MAPDTIQQGVQAVIDGLAPLAQKLQVPIEGLFGWAIRHNYAIAATDALLSLVLIVAGVVWFRKNSRSKHGYSADSYGAWPPIFLVLIGFARLFISEVPSRLIAPQWYALQDIINLIK